MNPTIQKIASRQLIISHDHFKIGDGSKVYAKVREDDKERVQNFSDIVIAEKHYGISRTFMIRRVIAGEGVERVFPIHSLKIVKIEVERDNVIVNTKLYYICKCVCKDVIKVKEKKR
jgi:large subunit ribosomal protein L19